jgi:hypothetical protein
MESGAGKEREKKKSEKTGAVRQHGTQDMTLLNPD